MTIQEAKEFFFNCLCSDYNMLNADETKFAAFHNLVDSDTKKKFCLEYVEMLLQRIYKEPEKSAYSFATVITRLGKREKEYAPFAERAVQALEECPFPDDFAKLMVMESIVGRSHVDGWGSGYSILCFYGDYSDRIRQAAEQYIHITFELPVPEYYQTAGHIPIEVLKNRAENVRTLNTERFQYVRSAEYKKKLQE